MSNTNKPFNKSRLAPTLYRNQADLKRATIFVTEELLLAQDGKPSMLVIDVEGFCTINNVVDFLREKEDMDYINSTHVIELFFKDPERKILINGSDRIKYKSVKYVKPPQILYFGTIENLKSKMVSSGIRSRTKGYVKLYATEDEAIGFASKFATNSSDRIVTIAVDSDKAFSDGLKFSTYVEGEIIVVQVDKKYLISKEGA
jgi:RNA:NAD 2'-phosphotransferase (TPT1/KptA family)